MRIRTRHGARVGCLSRVYAYGGMRFRITRGVDRPSAGAGSDDGRVRCCTTPALRIVIEKSTLGTTSSNGLVDIATRCSRYAVSVECALVRFATHSSSWCSLRPPSRSQPRSFPPPESRSRPTWSPSSPYPCLYPPSSLRPSSSAALLARHLLRHGLKDGLLQLVARVLSSVTFTTGSSTDRSLSCAASLPLSHCSASSCSFCSALKSSSDTVGASISGMPLLAGLGVGAGSVVQIIQIQRGFRSVGAAAVAVAASAGG